MASTASVVQFVVDQMGPGAASRAMFGEYGIYFRGTLVGLFCDDRLFLKPTRAAAALLGEHELGSPYPGAKPAIVVPEESWEDAALMTRLASETAAELGKAQPSPGAMRGKRAGKAPVRGIPAGRKAGRRR